MTSQLQESLYYKTIFVIYIEKYMSHLCDVVTVMKYSLDSSEYCDILQLFTLIYLHNFIFVCINGIL